MKKTVIHATLGILALAVASSVAAQVKPDEQIKYRKAGYAFMAWNMGKIKSSLEGSYNKDQVAAAAQAIASIAGSGMGALYAPGTEKDVGDQKTRVKPEMFQNRDEVGRIAKDFNAAAASLATAAAAGDQGAVKVAFGEVGKNCKACHDKFRIED